MTETIRGPFLLSEQVIGDAPEVSSDPLINCMRQNVDFIRNAIDDTSENGSKIDMVPLQLLDVHDDELRPVAEVNWPLDEQNLQMIEGILWAFGAPVEEARRYPTQTFHEGGDTVIENSSVVPLNDEWYLQESEQTWTRTLGSDHVAVPSYVSTMVLLRRGQPAEGLSQFQYIDPEQTSI